MNSTNNADEQWLPAPGYELFYAVSNLGNVKSSAAFIQHDGNWNKDVGGYIKKVHLRTQQTNRYGYKSIKMCAYGKCKRCLVHRLIARAFLPGYDPKLQINHIDGDKTNNAVSNLEWVTAKENMEHAWATGLMTNEHTVGSKHHKARVTEQDVVDMRTRYGNKQVTKDQLVAQYGLSKASISDILYRRTWKHVK